MLKIKHSWNNPFYSINEKCCGKKCKDELKRIFKQEFVVEVLSPSSIMLDSHNKEI